MATVASVAIQSARDETGKHLLNAGSGVAGYSIAPDYLAIVAGVISVIVGLLLIKSTYQDIQLKTIKLSKEKED